LAICLIEAAMTDASETDLALIRALVGRIIPASSDYGVPGADDDLIFADIVDTLRPNLAALGDLLASLDTAALKRASASDIDGLIQRLQEPFGPALALLIAVVAQCYYRDDRVMRSLDMEARPPFPEGFEVEAGDWSLLDPVRARSTIWRDAT
jgi:hypothetical protein